MKLYVVLLVMVLANTISSSRAQTEKGRPGDGGLREEEATYSGTNQPSGERHAWPAGVNLTMCRCLKFIQLPKQPRCSIFKHITSVFAPGYPCPDYRLIDVNFKRYCLNPVNLHHQECVECFQNRCRKMKINHWMKSQRR